MLSGDEAILIELSREHPGTTQAAITTSAARFASFLETHTMAALGPIAGLWAGRPRTCPERPIGRRMSQDLPSTQNYFNVCRFELDVETSIKQPNQRIVTFIRGTAYRVLRNDDPIAIIDRCKN
jgi:hypothetical protein